jgi:hypothetical protein
LKTVFRGKFVAALLGPAAKTVKLAQVRAALAVRAPDPVIVETVAAFMCRVERIGRARADQSQWLTRYQKTKSV